MGKSYEAFVCCVSFFCVFMDQNVDTHPCTPPVPLICFIAFCGKTSESRGVRQEEVWAAESTHHVELVTCCSWYWTSPVCQERIHLSSFSFSVILLPLHSKCLRDPRKTKLSQKSFVLYLTTLVGDRGRRVTQVSHQDWPFGVHASLQQCNVMFYVCARCFSSQ